MALLNSRSLWETTGAVVEANPHFVCRSFAPSVFTRTNYNALASDTSNPAISPSQNFIGRFTQPQFSRFNNNATAVDLSSFETNIHFVPRTWPAQWAPAGALRQNVPQDFSAPAVETNPHWRGKTWPLQWVTNPLLDQTTANDFSSSAVETNVHFIPHAWPLQWLAYKALWQNPATDAPVVAAQPDTPTYFVPGQLPWQWVLNLSLVGGTANDLTSSAVETNPQWSGRTYSGQWWAQQSLRQNSATDAPAAVDTPSYFISKQLPLRWDLNRVLGRNIAADFSSSAVETNVYFTPRVWPLRWDLQVSLTRGTAQDFSSVAPVVTSRPRVYIYT